MRGATCDSCDAENCDAISIHAPHAGRDEALAHIGVSRRHFNPRAPCGARQHEYQRLRSIAVFQSTRPMRGATVSLQQKQKAPPFQSTRPMRGATVHPQLACPRMGISIHAPHAGRDGHQGSDIGNDSDFNPRAPCGARQNCPMQVGYDVEISIHAPHAGRDQVRQSTVLH